ncbi:Nucleoside triphosphate pyrophosphohydrolase/pyrophosphatase MazG [Jeotgalibaca dankookensis]|uniref:Nucleoside triphosphate pyrophosphohydrolase/pyrophosphatase MazG n=1 Tax=Jeotgalibaca dankookensis TaxID=708126 RepID=A0A1S6IQL6_9LACT|nr:MazG nucleotide pyrophosphohydrolase domain-containing protein [Jeotgalibaca dankookensis]AQS53848.1 Nucleoside triphosphate pyrophosphohydrolase/pyrophosphatase MazG [Jeotgalibaca dankookensis]
MEIPYSLDKLLQTLSLTPLDGVQVLASRRFEADRLDLGSHILVLDISKPRHFLDIKEAILTKYPLEHPVALLHAIGREQESIIWKTLSKLVDNDRSLVPEILYIPPLSRDERTKSFATTQWYMDAIQAGDIWVQAQTHDSLLAYLEEESQEVAQAIANQDRENLIEELGDVLLQVLYHANHAEQKGNFLLEDILDVLNRKLRRRHPHVFDGYEVRTVEDIDAMWQAIKKKEKENHDEIR